MKKLKTMLRELLPFIILAVAFWLAIGKVYYRADQYRNELDSIRTRHDALMHQYEADQQFYQRQFDSLSLILQELSTRKVLTDQKITDIKARIDAATQERKNHLKQWENQ